MKINSKYILVLAVTLFFGELKAQIKQTVSNFDVLEVTDRLLVSIVPAADGQQEMEIKGDLADKVEAVYSGNTLKLKMKGGYIMQGNQASVILHAPSISKIVAKKGSEVNIESDPMEMNAFSVVANEGSRVRLNVHAVGVDAIANTGSVIDMLGSATKLNVSTTAGGSFYGKDLKTEIAYVRVNAGGKTEVYATESADVETRAGGTIDVYGNPAQTKHRKIAGGKISFHK